jgi:HK97 family phage prohead protease
MMALQGIALRYNEIIRLHRGENKMVLPGAFDPTLASDSTVKFQFKHHEGECVGSTEDNLELISDDRALVFRFRFPDSALGKTARAFAESNEPTEISVGFDYNYALKFKRNIGGLEVIAIQRAWLNEISWLNVGLRGAAAGTFASYVNVGNRSLRQDYSCGKLAAHGAAIGVSRAFQSLNRLLASGPALA